MTIDKRLELIRLLAAGEEVSRKGSLLRFPSKKREKGIVNRGEGLEKANRWQFKKCWHEQGEPN